MSIPFAMIADKITQLWNTGGLELTFRALVDEFVAYVVVTPTVDLRFEVRVTLVSGHEARTEPRVRVIPRTKGCQTWSLPGLMGAQEIKGQFGLDRDLLLATVMEVAQEHPVDAWEEPDAIGLVRTIAYAPADSETPGEYVQGELALEAALAAYRTGFLGVLADRGVTDPAAVLAEVEAAANNWWRIKRHPWPTTRWFSRSNTPKFDRAVDADDGPAMHIALAFATLANGAHESKDRPTHRRWTI